ncbi:MAG: TIGR03960 family B12-binding radical SAM protein [Planctomycetota bacterium]|nr:TIGR03960 family B12-binding radical SAM protein [Planctomycetota bacterium]
MTDLWPQIEKILPLVETPAQYIGGEVNSVVKEHDPHHVRIALAFPDTYKIGMSHNGLHLLYAVVNDRDDAVAERVFTPWTDMQRRMRERNIPLFTLETHSPAKEFDVLGFSLQHEMCYTNVLAMLDLAQVPLKSVDRGADDPIVVAGGPCAANPEPMAEFIDVFVVGDGEERIVRLIETLKRAPREGRDRRAVLLELARSGDGFYVPGLYEARHDASSGRLLSFGAVAPGVPAKVSKATIAELDSVRMATRPIIPFPEAVHDRITLEIMRGCPNSCRFCQSAALKSPVRWRSLDSILDAAEQAYENTGYDEISLISLSSGDCPNIEELLFRLSARFKGRRVGISLPSLRIDAHLATFPAVISAVRKAGLTLAPEAATDRLRKVINKCVRNQDFFDTMQVAFRQGWNIVKLYFMIGLPTETDADIDGIAALAQETANLRRPIGGHPANVNVTVSPFVPKPHTPFQWEAMTGMDRLLEIERRIRTRTHGKSVKYKVHNLQRSLVEGVMSRGDRRCGRAIELAYRSGCAFDSWDDLFRFDLWEKAFKEAGIDPADYAYRQRSADELLPWEHIDLGTPKDMLWKERELAMPQA